jgi:hypothetical protein
VDRDKTNKGRQVTPVRQPLIRTHWSGTIPLDRRGPLHGLVAFPKHDDAYKSKRADSLVQTAIHNLQFNPDRDEYRLGILPNKRWALLAVQEMTYLYAWEAKRSGAYRPRLRKPGGLNYVTLLNPFPSFSREYAEELLDYLLRGLTRSEIHERLNRMRGELTERRSTLDADIARHLTAYKHG